MRSKDRKVGSDGRVVLLLRPDEGAMPFPATGFGGLDEHEHQTPVKVGGKAAEHPLREERRTSGKRLENPLVIECLHAVAGSFSLPQPSRVSPDPSSSSTQ